MYPQYPEAEIQLQLHKKKSLESTYTAATDCPIALGVQSSEESNYYMIL